MDHVNQGIFAYEENPSKMEIVSYAQKAVRLLVPLCLAVHIPRFTLLASRITRPT